MNATCNTCDGGVMAPAKINRMSKPVVIIGYILLIPSILMILTFGGCALMSGGASATAATEIDDQYNQEEQKAYDVMAEAGYSKDDAETILDKESSLTIDQSTDYTPKQKEAITKALNHKLSAASAGLAMAGASAVGGFAMIGSIIGMVLSFVSGLVGWLLIMKKKVLKCNSCNATVDAA